MSSEQQVLRTLWSWRYWLLMWVGVASLISIAVVIKHPPLYRSTTHLYVNARNMAGEQIEGQFELPPPEVRKVYFLATSTEVLDHVVDKLKLLDKQPRVGALSRVQARDRLLKSIDVRLVEGNGITITVSSRHRDLAPRIANEVYRKVFQLLEESTIDAMDRSMRIHQKVFKGLEEQAGKFERSLFRVLDSSKVLRSDPERQMRLDLEFDRLLGQMSRTQQEMANIHRVQLVSAGLLRKEFSEPITLIRKADPDLSMNPLQDSILRVLLLVAFATMVVVGCMTLWATKRADVLHQWRLLRATDGPGGDDIEVEPVLDDLLDRSFRRAAPSSVEARSGSGLRV